MTPLFRRTCHAALPFLLLSGLALGEETSPALAPEEPPTAPVGSGAPADPFLDADAGAQSPADPLDELEPDLAVTPSEATPEPEIEEDAEAPQELASPAMAEPLPVAQTERGLNPRVPGYTQLRPAWALGLQGTLNAATLPSSDVATVNLRGVGLLMEWQPRALQGAGVFGIGAAFNYYFTNQTPDRVTAGGFAIWSFGGQFRYQARYFREQILVPFVGLAFESLQYKLAGNVSGKLAMGGPTFGAMFLLNALEPDAAGTFYSDQGVTRSYLVAEWRNRSGNDTNLGISGTALFFGLRIEY